MRIVDLVLFGALGATLAACGHHHSAPCNKAKHTHLSIVRVDDHSDYMQRAYAHSRAANDGMVEVDTWKADGRPAVTDEYFTGSGRAAIERYVASLEPALVVPFDHRLAYEHSDRGWRTFYVRTTWILDNRELATGEAHDGAARFELTPAAVKPFADATAEAVGHKLAFVVDGEVVSAPVVNSAIRGGTIEVTTPKAADADVLVHRLGCTK
jgi:hypothetical protein